jgi:hypothetical protein
MKEAVPYAFIDGQGRHRVLNVPGDPEAPLPGVPAKLPRSSRRRRRDEGDDRQDTPPGFASRFFSLLAIVGVITTACATIPRELHAQTAVDTSVCVVQNDAVSFVVRDPSHARRYFEALAVRLKEGDPTAPNEAGDLILSTLDCLP